MTTPNIVTGRVTRHANSNRTPNWLRALYAVLFTLIAVVALSLTLAP